MLLLSFALRDSLGVPVRTWSVYRHGWWLMVSRRASADGPEVVRGMAINATVVGSEPLGGAPSGASLWLPRKVES